MNSFHSLAHPGFPILGSVVDAVFHATTTVLSLLFFHANFHSKKHRNGHLFMKHCITGVVNGKSTYLLVFCSVGNQGGDHDAMAKAKAVAEASLMKKESKRFGSLV